jgi:hypothetical protein
MTSPRVMGLSVEADAEFTSHAGQAQVGRP